MTSESIGSVMFVVYAIDIERVAAFYSRTLDKPISARDAGFIVVGDADLEVTIVRMSAQAAAEVSSESATIRENTAIKPSFVVDALARVADAARANGGGTKPIDSAWEWRGHLHLDGHDPEGNVVQFRQPVRRG